MFRHGERRRNRLPGPVLLVTVLVLAMSAGAGMLLRDLQRVDPVAGVGDAFGGTSAAVAPA
ncbi:MAG TPA: hypothetical protein VHH34_25940, partial [Pseudonocardiaceae bacterium]|nr:hypothetical protein [Pseudonocardiaceae bacterium]